MAAVLLIVLAAMVFGFLGWMVWIYDRPPQTRKPARNERLTESYVRDSTIFMFRLRDWNNSLAGGLPDELERAMDNLIDRSGAALPQLPKGSDEKQ